MPKNKKIPKLRVPLPKQVEKTIPDETKYNRQKVKRNYEYLEDARDTQHKNKDTNIEDCVLDLLFGG